MKKKHLLIVYWDLGPGGIQKRIRDLVNNLGKSVRDYDVYILLRRKTAFGFDTQVSTSLSVKIAYYPFSGALRLPFGFIFWIAWQYVRIKPTVVLTFQGLLSAVLVMYKYFIFWIPVRLVLNEGAVTSHALTIDHISHMGLLVRLFYPLADRIIVPTRACKHDLISSYSVPDRTISIIPNWTLFTPSPPLPSRYDIAFIGRFSQEKNPLFVVRLAKKLRTRNPKIKIVMVGHGYMQPLLHDKIRQARLESTVTVLPFTDDVSFYLRRSKIIIVPSVNEGMPNVVLEAATLAIPALLSSFPGASEVVEQGKTGYIYTTLHEAMKYTEYMLSHTRVRRKMGMTAQKNAVKYFGTATQRKYISNLLSE